jgi:hypothetical protein
MIKYSTDNGANWKEANQGLLVEIQSDRFEDDRFMVANFTDEGLIQDVWNFSGLVVSTSVMYEDWMDCICGVNEG